MNLLADETRVGDTLVIDRRLGEGAYAEVYRVRHRFLGWQALKLFKRVGSLSETRGMLDEARLLSVMGHRNVVRLFDAGTVITDDGERGFFTMEYVAGGSLERLFTTHRGDVPLAVAVDVVEQVAAGLAVAHEHDPPILHRDLTPANVLVGYDARGMRIRIGDFGLAKVADPFSLAASAQGTYAFMAPEVMGPVGCTRAGDVYAVGAIAYLLLTGRLPYQDGTSPPSSPERFRRRLLAPSRFHEAVDPALDDVVTAALSTDRAERPADAGALAEALARRRRDLGVRGTTPSAPAAVTACAPGAHATTDSRALRLLAEARQLARRAGTLDHAADLLEEAISLSPSVREQHTERLTRWRRGVMM